MQTFVDVILPLPLRRAFTYSLPQALAGRVRAGCRVVVPFGRKRYYTGIVWRVHYTPPVGYEVKPVAALPADEPILLPRQFQFWQWIGDYYLCAPGDVMKAALPSGLKPEGDDLNEVEAMLPAARPQREVYVQLAPAYREEAALHALFDTLQRRAPKQLDLLMRYVEQSGYLATGQAKAISKVALMRDDASPAAFNGLVAKQVFEVESRETERQDEGADATVLTQPYPLSAPQQ
ncbi:MAG: primosomal protein N', partial [Prevotellaceae bacterium]|nr:primosomal protein N' [Prevotellaceae bacterium]